MKLIEIGPTWFRLPDDFIGGVPEALRALASYYESRPKQTPHQAKKKGRPTKAAVKYEDFRCERLGQFFEAAKENARLDGLICLMEGDVGSLYEIDIDKGWSK